ncbi:MAG: hypothetical protein OCC45_06365 [Desulfotalea sp.]
MATTQEEMFEKCETLGEEEVRKHLNANLWNDMTKRAHAKEWLRKKEDQIRNEELSKQEQRENELVLAAKEANQIAKESNKIAINANDLAKMANKRALIAVGIAITAVIIQLLTWLNKS